MPWTDPIDEATPDNNSGAGQGDDVIRQLKRAINERMASLTVGWPATEPVRIRGEKTWETVSISTVTAVAMPAFSLATPNAEALYELICRPVSANPNLSASCFLSINNAGTKLFWHQINGGGAGAPVFSFFAPDVIQVTQTTGGGLDLVVSIRKVS